MSKRRPRTPEDAPERASDLAAEAFERFALEWLRALARGADAGRAAQRLMAFVELAQARRIPWAGPVDAAARALSRRWDACGSASDLDAALFVLAQAALQLLAEALAQDRLAAARRSARSLELHAAAAAFVRACERQARSEGWSYLELLGRSIDAPEAH